MSPDSPMFAVRSSHRKAFWAASRVAPIGSDVSLQKLAAYLGLQYSTISVIAKRVDRESERQE